MELDLNIKNIGKLTDAKIRIGQFTVLAGPNNTGKSFVSKILYALFDAMNVNLAMVHFDNLMDPFFERLESLEGYGEEVDKKLSSLHTAGEELHNFAESSLDVSFQELYAVMPILADKVGDMLRSFQGIRSEIESMTMTEDEKEFPFLSNQSKKFVDVTEYFLTELHTEISDADAGNKFVIAGIQHKINENLTQTFQVPQLSDLKGLEEAPSKVDISDIGKFEFSNGEIEFNIETSGLRKLQQYSKVIYLESPLYWKLKNALESFHLSQRSKFLRRKRISGISGYFYDLASMLKLQYTGEMDFPKVYEKLIGKEVIDGKITISESGDLLFQQGGRSFSLPVTATGVANLGMLALLIERKILDKGTFLFVDEPEAHLHPAWQVAMAEALFALAKGGVNVVIATHSPDILKWLEVHIKKNPDDESLVALNQFPMNGDQSDKQDFHDKMSAIKRELTKPFADLYTAGL